MVLLESLAIAIALSTPAALPTAGETVLLDFTAPWCGPCRTMQSTVDQLAQAGYPVRQVDFDQRRDLAERYQVTSIPCFVMVVDGKEVDRVVGVTSRGRLEQMLQRASVERPGQEAVRERGQSPDPRIRQPSVGQSRSNQPRPNQLGQQPSAIAFPPMAAAAASEINSFGTTGPTLAEQLIKSAVRIKVDDATGHSYGTGTIIDARQGEALVLTCGHIFRDSKGQGPITVDLISGGETVTVPAQLISYDPDGRDLGLISIRPPGRVEVTKIAPAGLSVRPGQRVVSVGCDHGQNPTARSTHVTATDRYAGPPNIEAAGMPVEGRSGGGLFNAAGQLIGVCYAADAADDEGLYAALASIHAELDRLGLQDVYQGAVYQEAVNPGMVAPQTAAVAARETATPPAMPRQMPSPVELASATISNAPISNVPTPGATSGNQPPFPSELSRPEQAALAEIRSRAEGAEVVCIIRPKDPNAKSEVIVLDHVSAAFVDQLSASQRRPPSTRRETSLQVLRKLPTEVQDAAGWYGK